MLTSNDFNLWANEYDASVNLSEENNQYPFAGYKDVLNYIYKQVCKKENAAVLDIGFGTGTLTSQLYNKGYRIAGLDFSHKMVEIARKKMPNALLVTGDFSNEFSDEIKSLKYDYIISTYAIHHLSDIKKISFIDKICLLLKPSGKIFLGDISFKTKMELNECKEKFIDYWDYTESYFIYSQIKEKLKYKYNCSYKKISHCAGILTITLKDNSLL
ncbi:class I SAM-dependent methyltransferase [Clostridium sp. JN-1]|uniref:class I SAM-dependent methyltransferase n=1 Tax=Clostridium sp. JN-1 TaxID=2483110 RepID=UPI000F0B926F|nr:class I SAM-dependent methyltransferase [Clostridium sp. JN-1]